MRKSINKVKFSVILLSVIILTSLTGHNFAHSQTAPSISVSADKKSYSPGESGILTISFKTSSKVKVPKEPDVTVNLTSGEIEGQGLQDYTGGEGDYISDSKVRYNFVVPSGAASGSTITVSGNVRFGYCSTSDGVCKLGNKNFTAKIKVK